MPRPLTLEQAKARYVHRFTMEHIPQWSKTNMIEEGRYPAPQYRTDQEWYDNTLFHGESELASQTHCLSLGQTWPLGKTLATRYRG